MGNCDIMLHQFGITGIADILVYPTVCDYYFYAKIFAFLFLAIAGLMYFIERQFIVKPDLISCLGVSSLATSMLATIGSLIKSADGIPMVQGDILAYIIGGSIVFISLWLWKQ